jgi:uncharacterized protein YjbJ (UPF0337 family)
MNKDQIKGRIDEATGKVKESIGRMTNSPGLEDRGTVEKVGGKAQKAYGDVKEDLKKDLRSDATRDPDVKR